MQYEMFSTVLNFFSAIYWCGLIHITLQVPFYYERLAEITAFIINYMNGVLWDIIIYQRLKFNDSLVVEVRVWICNCTPLIYNDKITHPCSKPDTGLANLC